MRLYGIDAPEVRHEKKPGQPYYEKGRWALAEKLSRKNIILHPMMVNMLDGDGKNGRIIDRKVYSESGNIQMEMELKDGLPHGHFIRYYENGNKQMEGDAREGKINGHQTAWYESGQKKGEGEYQDGEQMPGWKDWDERGNLIGKDYTRS